MHLSYQEDYKSNIVSIIISGAIIGLCAVGAVFVIKSMLKVSKTTTTTNYSSDTFDNQNTTNQNTTPNYCSYCGSMLEENETKCSCCGASLKK